MKNIFKVLFSLMLSAILMVCPISAYAEGSSDSNYVSSQSGNDTRGNSYPYSQSNPLFIDSTWRTIATSTSGFNCNVTIGGYVTTDYIDVKMKDAYGNDVWTGYGVIDTSQLPCSNVFWCGSNVRVIQVRCNGGAGQAYAYQS